MANLLTNRIIKEGEYIALTGATVRETAKVFKIGKSTVHKDVTERLKNIDAVLYNEVKKILKNNKDERHLRGGIATKRKYLMQKEIFNEVAISKSCK